MAKARASKTELTDLQLLEQDDPNDPPLLSVTLSGKGKDLLAAREALKEAFPKATFNSGKGGFDMIVPMGQDDSQSRIVEEVFNQTQCGLGYQVGFGFAAREGETDQFKSVVLITLTRPNAADSLLGRAVMDMIERKLMPVTSNDAPPEYICTRNVSEGHCSLQIVSNGELVKTENQAKHYAIAMAAHFNQKLTVSAPKIRMVTMLPNQPMEPQCVAKEEVVEGRAAHTGHAGMSMILTGDKEDLKRARLAIGKGHGLTFELLSADELAQSFSLSIPKSSGDTSIAPKDEFFLRVNMPLSPDNSRDAIERVHWCTGCELPIRLTPAVLPSKGRFLPGVSVWFDTPGTEYNPAFVKALLDYVAAYLHTDIGGTFPDDMADDHKGLLKDPAMLFPKGEYKGYDQAKLESLQLISKLEKHLYSSTPPSPGSER